MELVEPKQRNKIHPHKFTLWVAIGSMVMMFAGLTSAYIVKRDQPNWVTFQIPQIFWYSTAFMLVSSVTMLMAVKAFRDREMSKYRMFLIATLLLGAGFIFCQWTGFKQIWESGITFSGSGAGQFLYVIAGLHAIHVIAGVVVLLVLFLKAFRTKFRSYNTVPVEVAGTFWHFVDLLWIYLFVFFLWIQ